MPAGSDLLLLFLAGLVTGVMNAVAGGGSFVAFPALLLVGIPPIPANVTTTVATVPGQFASVWAYRHDIRAATQFDVRMLLAVSVAGGLAGALILLATPSTVFAGVLPWLMLLATAIFIFGNFAPQTILRRFTLDMRGVLVAQFAIALYGGYFGAGIGFMMLAALTLYGMRDIHAMNGLKLVLALCMTVVSSAAFALSGKVHWTEAAVMCVATLIGGYSGALGAKRVKPQIVKVFIALLGAGLTAYFFVRGA
ncbi:MAG TPA: sulfite exporter TauE/SafE family protein [Stellaceae bacterium]|jgi:hypothetical protein